MKNGKTSYNLAFLKALHFNLSLCRSQNLLGNTNRKITIIMEDGKDCTSSENRILKMSRICLAGNPELVSKQKQGGGSMEEMDQE